MTRTRTIEDAGAPDTAAAGPTAEIHLNITFPSGARIGPGKATLLEGIRDTGSISAAARALGMDYKRAWLLLDSLDRAFDVPVVERRAGGPGGGGAALTDFGVELLERYRRIEAGALAQGQGDLVALQRHALPTAGPKV
ncbi:MAG TPA: LysR family transcriptional regulator [Candidatus Limnocylindrales bacterium]|nr:LysR family transcriptional regulator [Candidatus Limnocylindrales bacterium]